MLSILEILEDTTVDGPGFRTAIYAAGCPNACVGCHNPQSWDIANGHTMSTQEILEIVLADPFADVTFTGGDPMFQPEGFAELAKAIKVCSNKNIWCYTGFTFENIIRNERLRALLQFVDVLVDGPFVQSLRDESLLFRGSSNQRLIDVRRSLEKGEVVLYTI
ncbi:MAG: anaerobic ribonucleoside-triphosphate reductase activating protein [Bacteroidaceae bacterium]|nr:anaerobic ribonucleoside-triphosphate reductase activating protein [Bacteroidaceae bacterium]